MRIRRAVAIPDERRAGLAHLRVAGGYPPEKKACRQQWGKQNPGAENFHPFVPSREKCTLKSGSLDLPSCLLHRQRIVPLQFAPPRDVKSYFSSRVLKADKKAIFTAASKASEAAAFLARLQIM
jgi:hypothetical protein